MVITWALLILTDATFLIFLAFTLQHLFCVVASDETLHLWIIGSIAIAMISCTIVNTFLYTMAIFNMQDTNIGSIDFNILTYIFEAFTFMIGLWICKLLMSSRWLLNRIPETLTQRISMIARVMLFICGCLIIVFYILALFVYHNHTLIYIVYLLAIVNITINTISGYVYLKHLQQALNNVEIIDDEWENKIRTAKATARAFLVVCYIWIPMAVIGIFFILDFIFKFWAGYDQVLMNCIMHSVFWIFVGFIWIFAGFRIVNNRNERTLCRNCIKPGLRVENLQEQPLLNRDTLDEMEQMHAR